ncbi:unnamed protein product, partial [marine sediment metagenome]
MPSLPKLPKLGGFPKPPRISEIIKKANPVREIVEDARDLIKTGREEIGEVASSLRVEEQNKAPSEEKPIITTKTAIESGTACISCCRDHLSTSSSALSEGMRFARDKGIRNPEALRRIRIAFDELNAMERIDLAPDETVKLKGAEKDLANWTLRGSR